MFDLTPQPRQSTTGLAVPVPMPMSMPVSMAGFVSGRQVIVNLLLGRGMTMTMPVSGSRFPRLDLWCVLAGVITHGQALYVAMYAHDNVASPEHWRDATDNQIRTTAEFFSMLADPTRLRLLIALLDADRDVTTLAATVAVARPTVSQHLAKLRLAGLVTTHRDGRHALYRLHGGHVRALLTHALAQADHGLRQLPDHD